MRLRDILTGNTKHVIDEAALPPSPAALYYFLDDQDSQRGSKWNPKGVGRPRFNAFNRQVTELLRDPFVVANMLAALKMVSDRGPVVEPSAASDRAKLQSEQASRNIDLIVGVDSSDLSMAELGVLSKVGDLVHLSGGGGGVASAPGLAQQLDELVATPRAKPELALIKRRRVFLKLLEVAKVRRTKGGVERATATRRPRHGDRATAASVETRRGCMGDTISFAETWRFLTVAGRLAKVAYPGLFPGRRVAFADDNAQWTRLWAQQRLEHFNSFETNPLLQSWFAIVWPLQTLPLEKTLRELGVRSKPFVEVRAADFDIDAHSQPWLAKELAVLSVDGGYGRDLLKRTLYKLVWRHDPGAFPPAVFKKPRWTDAYKYRPEGPLQLEEDWKKDDVKSLEVQLKNTQKVPEVAEARLQVLDWFGIGCGDPGKDWVICVGDYVLYRNGTNAAGMTVADLSRLQDKRVVRTTAQLVALEAAETAAATPLAGPTGDAAAASTTVSAQPAAATRSTAVPATSTAATVAATSTAVEDGPSPRESLDAFLATNPSSKQVQEACMAWGFGRNEDVTQYKRAAKLDHGRGMTICRLARLNGINLLKYLVENIDELCFASRDYSPLVVPPDIAATAESLEPARKSRPTASYRPGAVVRALAARGPAARAVRAAAARLHAARCVGARRRRRRRSGPLRRGRRRRRRRGMLRLRGALGIVESHVFCVGCGQKAHVNCVGQRSRGDHLCDECAETPWRAPPRPTSTLLSMRVIRKMVDDDVQLTVLRENPKGGKSRDRYEAYKVATSAAEFQRLGGSAEDLRNDLVRGYVTLGGEAAKDPCVLAALLPATGAAAPRPRGEARAVARPELAPRPTTASDGAFQSCLRAIKAQGLQPGTSSAPDDWDPLRGLEHVLGDATCGLPLRTSYRAEAAAIRAAATPAQRRAFAGRATSTRTGPRRDGSTTSRRASPRRASRPTTAEARRRGRRGGGGGDSGGRADGSGDGDGGFDAAYPELLRIHNLPGFWHLLEAGGIKVIFKLYYKSLLGRCAHDVLKRKGITIKAAKFLQATELFYHVWEAMATALFRAHRKSQTFRESPVDLATPELYMDNFLEWYRAKRGTGDVPFVHYGGFVFGMGIYFRFCKKSISLKLPMLTFALQLIHLGACDITNKYNLKRQCFYSLVNFLTSSEDVAKGLLAASTVSLSGRQHHAVSSDAAQEIKQGEIQKSMGPKFGVAKVLIHSALNDLLSGVAKSFAPSRRRRRRAGGRSKNAQADIAALVAHFEAHDIFNYEGPARTSLPAGLTSKDYALPKGCVAPLDFTAPLDRQHQPVLERAFVAATELLTQAGLHQADEPVELAVPALRDDDDLSADGDESVSSQYSDAEPEVDESDSDDDDARLRADAEAREAGD
ncbi:hypothetical protein JL722_5216 [Aureococcus anophagefferens]|nr:hypothetical protein JL722_5216 [Aureococcus anophagefferens]